MTTLRTDLQETVEQILVNVSIWTECYKLIFQFELSASRVKQVEILISTECYKKKFKKLCDSCALMTETKFINPL